MKKYYYLHEEYLKGLDNSESEVLALKDRIDRFIEEESRSMSMEVITPEYIYRMWGGQVPLEDIKNAMCE